MLAAMPLAEHDCQVVQRAPTLAASGDVRGRRSGRPLGLVAGLGAGAIDAGLNAYAALHLSPRILTWLHASYGFGAATGPLVMVSVLNLGQSWRWGYALVGLIQIVLGTAFLATAQLW